MNRKLENFLHSINIRKIIEATNNNIFYKNSSKNYSFKRNSKTWCHYPYCRYKLNCSIKSIDTEYNMNFDDYEQLPTPSTSTNMIAGAAAGILEHCVMYPMDSIKVIQPFFILNIRIRIGVLKKVYLHKIPYMKRAT